MLEEAAKTRMLFARTDRRKPRITSVMYSVYRLSTAARNSRSRSKSSTRSVQRNFGLTVKVYLANDDRATCKEAACEEGYEHAQMVGEVHFALPHFR